jgi:hypothetical protein
VTVTIASPDVDDDIDGDTEAAADGARTVFPLMAF